MTRRISLLILAATTLAGCTSLQGRVPSLLPRDVERRDDLEPVRAAPAVKPDAALDARIAEFATKLSTNRLSFDTALTRAKTAVASAEGSAAGSDAWIDAQGALGSLDIARSDNLALAAMIERIAIDRAAMGLPEYPALAALRVQVEQQLSTEEAKVADIRTKIASN